VKQGRTLGLAGLAVLGPLLLCLAASTPAAVGHRRASMGVAVLCELRTASLRTSKGCGHRLCVAALVGWARGGG
jgi:hypothetical protein